MTLFKYLDPARQAAIIANATTYHAKVGRRRGYLSPSDADAYSRAFTSYPERPAHNVGPAADGYWDADDEACHWRAIRADEHAEREARHA